MFAKVYNFKFPGLSEAKVAATFCSEKLGKKIVPFNIRSLNISIGKCGSISINLKFESGEDLNKFEGLNNLIFTANKFANQNKIDIYNITIGKTKSMVSLKYEKLLEKLF